MSSMDDARAEKVRRETKASYRSIAKQLGYASATEARQAVMRARSGGQQETPPDPDPEPESDSTDDSPAQPTMSAPKSEWVDYAVANGWSREDAESATRQGLIDSLGG